MATDNFNFGEEQESKKSLPLDFKRIGYRAIRYWYLVVFSLVACLVYAWYINRYAVRIYPVTASVVIRETEETAGAELLYRNALIEQTRNYLNEPFVIKSYPLIQRVVEDLNFGVAFYQEGYLVTSEAYDYIPVRAELLKPNGSYGSRFVFKIIDPSNYSLQAFENGEPGAPESFRFGDSISFKNHNLRLHFIEDRFRKSLTEIPFLLELKNPVQVASQYVSNLQVEWALEGAGVLNLSITGASAKKEMDFINGLIYQYQQYDLEKKNQVADRIIDFIGGQLTRISDSLFHVEMQMQRFQNVHGDPDLNSEARKLLAKIESLEEQKLEFAIKVNYYDYLNKYIQKDGLYDQVILPSSIGVSDDITSSLLGKLIQIQTDLTLMTGAEKNVNPLIERKIDELKKIKEDILEAVRNQAAADQIRSEFISRQVSIYEKQLVNIPAASREYISIRRNYSLLENLYIFLMQKRSEAAISRASNTSDIIVVNPPRQGGAISPKEGQNFAIAVVAGFLIPLLVFGILELVNVKVQSKEDIEKITTIPFIGGVGHSDESETLIVKNSPKSGMAESFRALRSNLNFFTGNQSGKVFMITSSISGEGKTFTTINIATVFALSGKKTLIVGADMRRPRIFSDFGLSNERGLSTYLAQLNQFDEVIQKTEVENLFLVAGGPVPPNPSELLMTDRLEAFIKSALMQFDYVLFDTPPLALVTDAFIISRFADHSVFVVRQNYSPRDFLKSIQEYYVDGRLKNMGIILNDIYKTGLGYGYGYGYQYGYHYQVGKKKKWFGKKHDTSGYYE